MALEDLDDLPIQMHIRIDAGCLPAALLAALKPGDVLPLPAGALRGNLVAAGRTLACGECGVSGSRYALSIDHLPVHQGS
jgi:flagellar motor switch protein FliM